MAPFWAWDCKSQQNPCYEVPCAQSLQVFPSVAPSPSGFFHLQDVGNVCQLYCDVVGIDGL